MCWIKRNNNNIIIINKHKGCEDKDYCLNDSQE
ncbi:hypothetical protein G210_2393 [Candida maltosa Xu316]|uniref:Uncharacterized protein n=1 Tax=Candida maltosa (strain Xu316) TaxID=1245528 RepID=M3JXZ4_CANMX|nr:hypothetical protein G210_2393 [Candida maltosa Xu316]